LALDTLSPQMAMARRHSKPARTSHFADPALQGATHESLQPDIGSEDTPPGTNTTALADIGSEETPLSTNTTAPARKRLLSYVPHSGWGNQLRALTNALFLASSLDRTLVVPRALKHSDMAGYGTCSASGNLQGTQLEAGAHLVRHDAYAKIATERPPVSNFLDQSAWHNVPSVEHIVGRTDDLSVQSVIDQCVNETVLVSEVLPRLRSEEAALLQMGSTFTLHAPRACTCAIAYRKELVASIMKLGASKLGDKFDALHLRLDEGQRLKSDAQQLVSAALSANVARPLYLATDNVHDAIRVVTGVNQRLCSTQGQCRRHIFTQQDLDADRAGKVLGFLNSRAQHESEFMRPLLIDAVLAMGSSSFFASNRSTFSSHIKEMRSCARFPGLNDCSPRTVSASESRTKLQRSLDLLASQG
jgi:hypothetical protein